jgi:hypothetical protein
LLDACRELLSASPVFVLLNVYTTVLTRGRIEKEAELLRLWLREMLGESRVAVTAGELALEDGAGRRISASVFGRAAFTHPR